MSAPRWIRIAALPIGVALVALGAWLSLGADAPRSAEGVAGRATPSSDAGSMDGGPRDAGSRDAGSRDAGSRDAGPTDAVPSEGGPPGLLSLVPSEPIRCAVPEVEIPARAACERGSPYPYCKWGIPRLPREGRFFRVWRNTTPEHRWARPGLVSLLMAAAAEHHRRWPESDLRIGDLDAPGPRHATHRRGQDVDLYLPDAMIARNELGGNYPDNYEGRPDTEVRQMRAEVLDFARILARCAEGEVRIYYNDPVVEQAFLAWFEGEGLSSSVGAPMEAHNELHRFHFHLTVPLDLPPL
ncbi:MAG: penicillin-insensitive murein endopeptidase [Sandaracinaceae bacterium]